MKDDKFNIEELSDGTLTLECGEGMNRDLVFVESAMTGDPDRKKQKEILEFIIRAIKDENINLKHVENLLSYDIKDFKSMTEIVKLLKRSLGK